MDDLLGDPDSDVKVISATYLSSLVRVDTHLHRKAKPALERAEIRLTKRIVESAIREYLSWTHLMEPDFSLWRGLHPTNQQSPGWLA